ncbi:unnamed protein product, partial [Rotaria magnacalcarata]
SPVATVFVDFKSAFDQLWFAGCLGKLLRMGISKADIKWIGVWLYNRRAVVEIAGKRSRWFPIKRGGPQGSCFTRILFITYRSDMEKFLCMEMSFFFADDLAAAILSVQPINYIKTQAMFSARVVNYPNPMPRISCGGYAIEWVKTYKYLGYWVTTKIENDAHNDEENNSDNDDDDEENESNNHVNDFQSRIRTIEVVDDSSNGEEE